MAYDGRLKESMVLLCSAFINQNVLIFQCVSSKYKINLEGRIAQAKYDGEYSFTHVKCYGVIEFAGFLG